MVMDNLKFIHLLWLHIII